MLIRVSFSGRDYDRATGLPSALQVEKGTPLSRVVDAIQRQTDPDTLLRPAALISVNGNPAGTLAAPDHRDLHDGDEITVFG